jgi:hypothetical protein
LVRRTLPPEGNVPGLCQPQHSTHLPEPSGPTDERFVYHLTDEGRRVLAEHEADTGEQLHLPAARFAEIAEAAEREQRRQRREALAEQAKQNGHRVGTISYRWKNEKQFPLLRLSGDWLAEAGFPLGQLFRVTVNDGQLVIDVV